MSKIALVTGASSGIGRAIAIRLAKDGFTIQVHYSSNLEGAQKTLAEVIRYSPKSTLLQFDISKASEVESALLDCDLDILVNNAGVHLDSMALLMTNDAFEKVIQTNLVGPFYITKICAKKMLLKKSGCIVNISSLAGQTGNAGQINYSASKAGLIAMTKTLAMELGSRGIRVNAVAPGLIETKMTSHIPQLEDLKSRIPLKRLGSPEEVAGAVSFLCSADASYITGHTINVNGGLYSS